jgi:cytidylate kinase
MQYRNIIICGNVGTGTSTLGKALAENLGWKYLSAGDFFREYHKEHSIPLWDKAAIPDELERKIDSEFLEKIKNESNYIFDAHYAGWFARDIKDAFKILLVCDKETATQRILAREHTHQESPQEIETRRVQLRDKFHKLYSPDDYEDPKWFDLVIDTTTNNSGKTVEIALEKLKD